MSPFQSVPGCRMQYSASAAGRQVKAAMPNTNTKATTLQIRHLLPSMVKDIGDQRRHMLIQQPVIHGPALLP